MQIVLIIFLIIWALQLRWRAVRDTPLCVCHGSKGAQRSFRWSLFVRRSRSQPHALRAAPIPNAMQIESDSDN